VVFVDDVAAAAENNESDDFMVGFVCVVSMAAELNTCG
jgi:hypothetical protein